jgi:hypothetical protein
MYAFKSPEFLNDNSLKNIIIKKILIMGFCLIFVNKHTARIDVD